MKKIIFIVIIFSFFCQSIESVFPETGFNLRLPLKFNNLSLLNKIHSEVIREMESHIEWLKKESMGSEYENSGIAGYLPLPAVKFLLDKDAKSKYKYSRGKNEITFYISTDMSEKEFKKLCWLAYGNWFSKNEAGQHDYIYENYSDQLWPDEYLTYMKRVRYIDREEVRGKFILDAATGPGIPGVLIAEQGAGEVTCLDVSEGMLSKAKEKAAERNLRNIIFKQGSFFELSCPNGYFDIVFANYAFNRNPVELRRIALQEILRVLKPGGMLKIYEVDTDIKWSNSDWKTELEQAGYEKVNIIAVDRDPTGYTPLMMTAYKPQNSIASNATLLTSPCSDDELKKLDEIEGNGNIEDIRAMMSKIGKKKIVSVTPAGRNIEDISNSMNRVFNAIGGESFARVVSIKGVREIKVKKVKIYGMVYNIFNSASVPKFLRGKGDAIPWNSKYVQKQEEKFSLDENAELLERTKKKAYEQAMEKSLEIIEEGIGNPEDIGFIFLQDIFTVGLIPLIKDKYPHIKIIWVNHRDFSDSPIITKKFLWNYLKDADVGILGWSKEDFPEGEMRKKAHILPVTGLNPFDCKNVEIELKDPYIEDMRKTHNIDRDRRIIFQLGRFVLIKDFYLTVRAYVKMKERWDESSLGKLPQLVLCPILEDRGIVTKDQVEQVGLNWTDVSQKLTDPKNGWADEVSPTEVHLKVELDKTTIGAMSKVFGDDFPKILPILDPLRSYIKHLVDEGKIEEKDIVLIDLIRGLKEDDVKHAKELLLRLSNKYKGDLGDYFRKMAESLSNPNPGNEEINRKIINFLEVNALQTIADIGMHVSMYESFGVAITELLWKGKLTIASTEGGISEQYPKEMQKDFLIDISEDYKGKLRDIENKYKKGEYDEELERMLNGAMDPSSELSEKMLRLLLLNDSEIEAKSQGLREYIRKRYLILNSVKEHLEYLLGNFPRGVNNLEGLKKSRDAL